LLNHCFFPLLIIDKLLLQPLLLVSLLGLEPNLLQVFPETLQPQLFSLNLLFMFFLPFYFYHSIFSLLLPFYLLPVLSLHFFLYLLLVLNLLLVLDLSLLPQALNLLPLSILNLPLKNHISMHFLLELSFLLFYLSLSEFSSLLFLHLTDFSFLPVLSFDLLLVVLLLLESCFELLLHLNEFHFVFLNLLIPLSLALFPFLDSHLILLPNFLISKFLLSFNLSILSSLCLELLDEGLPLLFLLLFLLDFFLLILQDLSFHLDLLISFMSLLPEFFLSFSFLPILLPLFVRFFQKSILHLLVADKHLEPVLLKLPNLIDDLHLSLLLFLDLEHSFYMMRTRTNVEVFF